MSKVSIVIPLYYNTQSLFKVIDRCLSTLKEYYPNMPLILIDDASPMETSFWPITKRLGQNKGYTGAVNEGLELWARTAKNDDAVIICNDDIFFHKGSLDRFFEIKGIGIWLPMDTAATWDNDRFGSIWGITKQTYDLLGKLNESYKHFFSDLDYYNRAQERGVKIVKWFDVMLEHPESSTYKTIDKDILFRQDRKTFLKNS